MIAGLKGLTDDGGILFLQLADNVFVDRRQRRLLSQVELVVQDDAIRAHGEQAGGGMPAHPAMDKYGQIGVFEIPL